MSTYALLAALKLNININITHNTYKLYTYLSNSYSSPASLSSFASRMSQI